TVRFSTPVLVNAGSTYSLYSCGWKRNLYTLSGCYAIVLGMLQLYLVRNQIFALLFCPLITCLWYQVRFRSRHLWLFAFPPLMLAWSRMHGTVMLGMLVLLLILAGEGLHAMLDPRRKHFLLLLALSFGASYVVTDHFWNLNFPSKIGHALFGSPKKSLTADTTFTKSQLFSDQGDTSSAFYRFKELFRRIFKGGDENVISEYRSPFDVPQLLLVKVLFAFIALFMVYLASLWGRPKPWHLLLPALFCAYLSLGYLRTTAFAFCISLIFMAMDLRTNAPLLPSWFKALSRHALPFFLLLCCATLYKHYEAYWKNEFSGLVGFMGYEPGLGTSIFFRDPLPELALERYPKETVLNSYSSGGYLLWKWYGKKKVVIDGRSNLLDPKFLYLYYKNDSLDLVEQKKIGAALLNIVDIRRIYALISKGWTPTAIDLGMVLLERKSRSALSYPELHFDAQELSERGREPLRVIAFLLIKALNQMLSEGRVADTDAFVNRYGDELTLIRKDDSL
ncbi:MAG: hypothetical protein HQL31_02960, partial [Planctomycetes bacterium]|nr:hypothetical protein [Planctomycetota bacterium]